MGHHWICGAQIRSPLSLETVLTSTSKHLHLFAQLQGLHSLIGCNIQQISTRYEQPHLPLLHERDSELKEYFHLVFDQ